MLWSPGKQYPFEPAVHCTDIFRIVKIQYDEMRTISTVKVRTIKYCEAKVNDPRPGQLRTCIK